MGLVLSSVLCVLCSYIGYYISKVYKDNEKFYKQWLEYNEILIREITFNKNPVLNINKQLEINKTHFCKIISSYMKYLNNDIDDIKFKSDIKANVSFKRDIQIITNYFISLGSMDYKSQINNLENYLKIITKKYDSAKQEVKTKGNLALKLGLLFGIGIMIILA